MHAQNTIIVLGRDKAPLYEAKVSAGDNVFVTNTDGKVEYKDRLHNTIITVSASGYQTRKVDLRKYPPGTFVPVVLTKLAAVTQALHVYVRDKKGNPVAGAAVTVLPGVSGVTDGNGYAIAGHKQQPGEYIEIIVSANGYKDQQKRILVGVKQGNAITQPEDVATFVLEKGDNDRNIYNLIIEVLDDENNEPVKGAAVKVQLSDGASFSGSTNSKGEATFTDADFGFQGTTARVMVTHKDYKEKWSDITGDLMTAKDMDIRRFLVHLTKKEDTHDIISGTWNWVSGGPNGVPTMQLNLTEGNVSGGCVYGSAVTKITGGSYDAVTKRLSITFIQEWSKKTGKADFDLGGNPAYYILTGTWNWDNNRSDRNSWTMDKRK